MEHIDAAQAVLALHLLDALEQGADVLARDGAVHAVVVGRDAAGGGKAFLRPLQKRRRSLSLCDTVMRVAPEARSTSLMRAISSATSSACRRTRTQQDGGGIEVVAGVHEFSTAAVAGLSIISRPAGMMPAAITSATALPPFSTSSKLAMMTWASWGGDQPHGDLGHHRQHALGADQHRQQVEAGRVGASEPNSTTSPSMVTAHALVHGQSVLQAVHAARVLADVAADGAGDLRGGSGA